MLATLCIYTPMVQATLETAADALRRGNEAAARGHFTAARALNYPAPWEWETFEAFKLEVLQ